MGSFDVYVTGTHRETCRWNFLVIVYNTSSNINIELTKNMTNKQKSILYIVYRLMYTF